MSVCAIPVCAWMSVLYGNKYYNIFQSEIVGTRLREPPWLERTARFIKVDVLGRAKFEPSTHRTYQVLV